MSTKALKEKSRSESLRTEQGLVETSVLKVLVHKKPLLAFQAAPLKLDKIAVLDARDKGNFVKEFRITLLRPGW